MGDMPPDFLREHMATGGPYGDEAFMAIVERATGQKAKTREIGIMSPISQHHLDTDRQKRYFMVTW